MGTRCFPQPKMWPLSAKVSTLDPKRRTNMTQLCECNSSKPNIRCLGTCLRQKTIKILWMMTPFLPQIVNQKRALQKMTITLLVGTTGRRRGKTWTPTTRFSKCHPRLTRTQCRVSTFRQANPAMLTIITTMKCSIQLAEVLLLLWNLPRLQTKKMTQ